MTSSSPAVVRTVTRSVTSSAFLGIASLLAGVLLLPVAINKIGSVEYGFWILLTTMTVYLYQADLGMGSAVVRFASAAHANEDRHGLSSIACSSLAWMSGVGFLVAPIVGLGGFWLLRWRASSSIEPTDILLLSCLSAGVLLVLGLRAFSALLQAVGLWATERQYQLVGLFIRVVGTLVICFYAPSIAAIAITEASAMILPSLIAAIKIYRMDLIDIRFSLVTTRRIRELLHYSVRSFAVGAIGTAIIQVGTVISGLVLPAGQVAYYSAILRVYLAVRQAITWVVDPFLPVLSKRYEYDRSSIQALSLNLISASSLVGVVGSVALLIATPDLLQYWLGKSAPLDSASIGLRFMLLAMAVNCLHIGSVSALNAVGMPGAFLRLHVVWLVSTSILCLGLGYRFGMVGISLGNAVPILALEAFYIRRGLRLLSINPDDWWRGCVLPVILSLSFGLFAMSGAGLAAMVFGISVGSIVLSVAFFAGCVSAGWVFRESRPVKGIRGLFSLAA
ncbi:oligosaccharide flippase family protein [Rhodococcus pyridinivorans]|uniref:oligosaccharide flippase family protein n=1 Tax=Rhodococcus pyridinivorans TaxID=103816 RepID=UPI0037CACBED